MKTKFSLIPLIFIIACSGSSNLTENPARSIALDIQTAMKESAKDGRDISKHVFLGFDYLPESLDDFDIFPSVRNAEGRIVLHHTNHKNINKSIPKNTITKEGTTKDLERR